MHDARRTPPDHGRTAGLSALQPGPGFLRVQTYAWVERTLRQYHYLQRPRTEQGWPRQYPFATSAQFFFTSSFRIPSSIQERRSV